MAAARRVEGVVRRLETRVATVVSGRPRVVLAYSGGLASTLVAMIARKRCDLECVVAGVEGAADWEAAKVAKTYLDYRMNFVTLDREEVRRVDDGLSRRHADSSPTSRAAVLPIHAVRSEFPRLPVLSGFGAPRMDPSIGRALRDVDIRSPLHGIIRGPLPRTLLADAAISLGLPRDWARVRHRSPPDGSGIAAFLPPRRPGSR